NLLTNTNTVIDLPDASKYEIFEYPGDYQVKGVGTTRSKVRMEEEEAQYDVAAGGSEAYGLTAGATFSLGEHAAAGEAGKYLITSIHHVATDASLEAADVRASYRNTFQCIPAATPYRPMRQSPKPFIAGVQTAVVVGPS